jgi:hypothetical protein
MPDQPDYVGRPLSSFTQAEIASSNIVHLGSIQIVERPPSPPLPEGWKKVMSQSQGKFFYHHKPTGATSWERPSSLPAVAEEPNKIESGLAQVQEVQDEATSPVTSSGTRVEAVPKSAGRRTDPEVDHTAAAASAYGARRARMEGAAPFGPSRWRGERGDDRTRDREQVDQIRERDRDRDGEREREPGSASRR